MTSSLKSLIFTFLLFAQMATAQTLGSIILKNNLSVDRKGDVVEVPFATISPKIASNSLENVLIKDEEGKELPIQWSKNDKGVVQSLLIWCPLKGNQQRTLSLVKGTPKPYKTLTFGRFVPERFDDFAWENDKVAFRMYGPALSGRSDNAFGTDVWSKRTTELVIDKWYKKGKYHDDEGEGCDYYHVGLTLGCGSIEPYVDSICFAKNYSTYKVIENGPLRTTFELGYKAWKAGNYTVEAVRKISLEAGAHMNKVEATFTITEGGDSLPIVTGIIKRKGTGTLYLNEEKGIVGYWEPTDAKHGTTGTAVVFTNNNKKMTVTNQHLLAFDKLKNQESITYYNGQAYDRQGDVTMASQWIKYLEDFKAGLVSPVQISVK
jgi:hypothetical protein